MSVISFKGQRELIQLDSMVLRRQQVNSFPLLKLLPVLRAAGLWK